MQPLKITLAIFLFLSQAACQSSSGNPTKKNAAKIILKEKEKVGYDGTLQEDTAGFRRHIRRLKQFATINGYSTHYAMVIDLGLHSGAKRFFMIRLSNEETLHAGLVTHGSSPSVLQPGQRVYSNVEGSLCSSLGRYKIGVAYQGTFGLAYKMHGLDTSNNHAFVRAVVLHAHECVPDRETEEAICQSWGCPTVSPAFLKTISTYIDKSSRPMLLEIYDSTQ